MAENCQRGDRERIREGRGGVRGKEAKHDVRTGEQRGMETVYLCVREKGL